MPTCVHLDDRRIPSAGSQRSQAAGWLGRAVLLAALSGWALTGQAQTPGASASPTSSTSPTATPTAPKPLAKPLWRELSAKQQTALQPLAADWDGLSEGHKRKWLTLSRNHSKLSAADKQTLHSRMTDWAALSQQQRAQARFNFAEVKQVPVDERKAKWEAYQALTPEEKRRLAESAAPRPPGAATTIRPVPAQKLAPIPQTAAKGQHSARIQLTPPVHNAARLPAAVIAPPSVGADTPLPAAAGPATPAVPPPATPPRSGMTEPPSLAP